MRPKAPCIVLAAALLAMPPAAARAGSLAASEALTAGDYAGVLHQCADAAKAGDADCQNLLGLLYTDGKGVPADPAEGVRWFRLAAEQDDPTAAVNLALAYQLGRGVKADLAEAEKWYGRAAAKGDAQGELGVGLIVLKRERDWKAAMPWFRPAASQGLPEAQSTLGLAYEYGSGVRQNPRLAAKWYEAAARHGFTLAQSHLASLYDRGLGVPRDPEQAYFWYALALGNAADTTRSADETGLKRAAAALAPSELAEMRDAVQKFTPQPVALRPPRRLAKARRPRVAGHGLVATGSGFFVSTAGDLLTNNHVVAQCSEVRVTEAGKGVKLTVTATDPARDLALLKAPHGAPAAAVFRGPGTPQPGESVVAVGYPLAGLLSSDPIVTNGIINALAGPHDNRRLMQISAPIQPGNSGGPVFDAGGAVIGVAVSTLSTVRVAQVTGAIPEDINFAVKGAEARQFLVEHGVTPATAPAGGTLTTAAIAARARPLTVRLECWR